MDHVGHWEKKTCSLHSNGNFKIQKFRNQPVQQKADSSSPAHIYHPGKKMALSSDCSSKTQLSLQHRAAEGWGTWNCCFCVSQTATHWLLHWFHLMKKNAKPAQPLLTSNI